MTALIDSWAALDRYLIPTVRLLNVLLSVGLLYAALAVWVLNLLKGVQL